MTDIKDIPTNVRPSPPSSERSTKITQNLRAAVWSLTYFLFATRSTGSWKTALEGAVLDHGSNVCSRKLLTLLLYEMRMIGVRATWSFIQWSRSSGSMTETLQNAMVGRDRWTFAVQLLLTFSDFFLFSGFAIQLPRIGRLQAFSQQLPNAGATSPKDNLLQLWSYMRDSIPADAYQRTRNVSGWDLLAGWMSLEAVLLTAYLGFWCWVAWVFICTRRPKRSNPHWKQE